MGVLAYVNGDACVGGQVGEETIDLVSRCVSDQASDFVYVHERGVRECSD